ncbi:polysaccharide deacetylase family protein [Desulforamulus putei]|uniref:Peptidoglycan/xylan/chitin deacetylase, PgdA/CDA1 family n=1 Tax=Desulforamulus putei DSM 12395 TaxID=1121429 RepID=A0A1M4XAV6_9FIRM|nr:polysaccharide deacetylase family protein [Desulforamulus putei]SHE90664.1 Peptidoglycan/xylan/chitin deacetylase, PgdA/CDA1 family [Desulforamulus putei DSM 12395]
MSFNIFKLAGLVIFLYMLLPTILGRTLHLGALYRGSKKSGMVALTFDDGPDPRYTPQVLDILKKYQVRASFFLVGRHAEQHPHLVKRIMAEGHSLGTHGYNHRFVWLQNPLSAIQEIRKGIKTIEGITGKVPLFFRPSWGVFNLFTYLYLLLARQRTVLWSLMSWDWHPRSSPDRIHDIVNRKIKAGAVIVFHDRCTKPGAADDGPAKMVEALPKILESLQLKGLRPVSLDEFMLCQDAAILKKCLRGLWQVWEFCFDRLAGLKPVGGQESNLFRLAVRNYRGQQMELPDGTLLLPGDKVGELHFNNEFLQRITATARSLELIGIMLLRETRRSLPLLAKAVSQDPTYQGIKALIGITMIHRGTSQLGFSVYDLTPGIRSIVAWYQRWLLFLLHPGGLSHLRRQWNKLVPKKVVISRQELLKRYLSDGVSWSESGNTRPAKGTINAR